MCDRCKKVVIADIDPLFTSGVYDVSPASFWHKYGQPTESFICEPCMWHDVCYIKDFGQRSINEYLKWYHGQKVDFPPRVDLNSLNFVEKAKKVVSTVKRNVFAKPAKRKR